MSALRFAALFIFATGARALAQEPPYAPAHPPPGYVMPPDPDPSLTTPPPPPPVIVPVPVVPVTPVTPEPDHRWLPASKAGFGLTLGAGVTDYLTNQAKQAVDVGPEWAARLAVGTRSIFAGEAAYVGSTQRVQGLNAAQGQLLSNGIQGLARVNIGVSDIQPYFAAGLGYRHYNLVGFETARATSDLQESTDVGEVPAATGIAFRGRGFLLDARFNVGMPFTRQAVRSVQGINATTWGVNGNLGFEF